MQSLCRRWLDGLYTPVAHSAGMHLVLERTVDDRAVEAAMTGHGYYPQALSRYGQTADPRQGLVVGFASATEPELTDGIERLARLG